ncbi:hypothetical protein QF037_009152 [Streptomyces canus]|nr:hypothetical protein [Streptomyces canus]
MSIASRCVRRWPSDEIEGPPLWHVTYAVLHLQAAAEVLLKARLLREHWSLVFKNPGQASEHRFLDGDFESCGIDATVRRLRQIVGLRSDGRIRPVGPGGGIAVATRRAGNGVERGGPAFLVSADGRQGRAMFPNRSRTAWLRALGS